MGYSYKGRLGCLSADECEKKEFMTLPLEIKQLEGIQISQIFTGKFHTLAITAKGKIYAWGENKNFVFGQIKWDPTHESIDKKKKTTVLYYPKEIDLNKQIGVNILI